jgi:hypothetical protein
MGDFKSCIVSILIKPRVNSYFNLFKYRKKAVAWGLHRNMITATGSFITADTKVINLMLYCSHLLPPKIQLSRIILNTC